MKRSGETFRKNMFSFYDKKNLTEWALRPDMTICSAILMKNIKKRKKIYYEGNSYQMLLNHLSHTITNVGNSDKWAQFEVIILDREKIYHKFNWQVEKYTVDGDLKDCWLTTAVSQPMLLGSSI